MSQQDYNYQDFKLPVSVANKRDLSHLLRDFERVDNEFTTSKVREKVGSSSDSPQLTDIMGDFLQLNQTDFSGDSNRTSLIQELRKLKDSATVVHMTFSGETDPDSLQKIVAWARESLGSQVLVEASVQPSLVAGVYVRTSNKVHDLSLRSRLKQSHGTLVKQLGALNVG